MAQQRRCKCSSDFARCINNKLSSRSLSNLARFAGNMWDSFLFDKLTNTLSATPQDTHSVGALLPSKASLYPALLLRLGFPAEQTCDIHRVKRTVGSSLRRRWSNRLLGDTGARHTAIIDRICCGRQASLILYLVSHIRFGKW